MATKIRKTKKIASSKKILEATTPTQKVGVRELRQSASQILDRVKNGTVVEITEHGVLVARLVPIKNSLYEEYIESGLITPAINSDWRPTKNPIQIEGSKGSTELLMELRAEERY